MRIGSLQQGAAMIASRREDRGGGIRGSYSGPRELSRNCLVMAGLRTISKTYDLRTITVIPRYRSHFLSFSYLTAQLSVSYVELTEHVAGRERHFVQVTRIPSWDKGSGKNGRGDKCIVTR
jgi:hypothetical protein